MQLLELSALIQVREFAVRNLDNVYFKMTSEEVKMLRNKISMLDKQILEAVLKLDTSSLTAKDTAGVPAANKKKNENTKLSS